MASQSELQIVLSAKDEVTKELKKVQKELSNLSRSLADTQKASSGIGTRSANDFSLFSKHIDTADEKAKTLVGTLAGLGKLRLFGAIGGFLAVRELGGFLNESIVAAKEAEMAQAQLSAVLASTGSVAGMTAESVNDLAMALQATTTFEDDTIVSAEALLLTFTKIGKDVFPQTTQAVLDMSTAMGTDWKSSALQIGKALNDPIANMGALTRNGVTFTEGQKDMIETLVEAGDLLGAQTIILGELSKEFGGSAAAQAQTYSGQIAQMKNNVGNLKEEIGTALLPSLGLLSRELSNGVKWLNGVGESASQVSKVIYAFTNIMLGLGKSIFVGLAVVAGPAIIGFIGGIKAAIAIVTGFIDTIKLLGGAWEQIKSGDFSGAAETIGDAVSEGFGGAFENLAKETKEMNDSFNNMLLEAGSSAMDSFKEAYDFSEFKPVMPDMKMPIIEDLGDVPDEVKDITDEFKKLFDVIKKFNDGMEKFDEQFAKAKETASDSIATIRKQTNEKMASIKADIQGVIGKIVELRAEFAQGVTSDRNDLASKFVEAEQKVKDLKEELARATDVQQIFDIKTQIKEQEQALEKNKDVQQQFASEIEAARNHANLSEIEQAIADYNTKRSIAQQEFNDKLADLEAEKELLRNSREEEKQIGAERIAEVRATLKEKLAAIEVERKEFIKNLTNEVLLEGGKGEVIKQITSQVENFRKNIFAQTNKAVKSGIQEEIKMYEELGRAIQKAADNRANTKTSKKVNDAVISPRGDVVSTHPDDWIIATKNPGALAGQGGGVTVVIDGGIYMSEDSAEKIGNLVMDKLKLQVLV